MVAADARAALERVAKWRSVFAGWQLGTRRKGDPTGDAVRDHREATIMLRVEATAIVTLLVEKGVITGEEFWAACGKEADLLNADLARRFPGMTATDVGMAYDERAADTMKGWLP